MINKILNIEADIQGDGTTVTVTLDIARDPYWIMEKSGFELRNGSQERMVLSPPVGVTNVAIAGSTGNVASFSLAGTVLTVTAISAGFANGSINATFLF